VTKDRYTIHPAGKPLTVQVQRDRRLKKSARWIYAEDGSILLRVPYRTRQANIARMLGDLERKLSHQRRSSTRRTDADLQARAEYLNRTCFRGEIRWTAIRWVGNMEKRLGSCTNGGDTDGHIRISTRLRRWPQWVIDYVIAHELAHRVYPDHSQEFWEYLQVAYPLTERARGFIQGMGFACGETLEEEEL
jgi:predicted metal-dependent hydrolase